MKKFVFQRERKFQGMDWTPCGLQGDGTASVDSREMERFPCGLHGNGSDPCGLQGDGPDPLWTIEGTT